MIVGRSGPHLGELVAALVDGVLSHQARERCLGHLARCEQCRAEVDAHRALKGHLSGLAAPGCPRGLVDRLRVLPDAAPAGRAPDDASSPLPPVRLAARFRPPPAARPRPSTVRRLVGRPLLTTAAGVLAAFGLTLATVVAVGGAGQPQPVTPPVGTFSVEHSRVSDTVPGADPDAGLVDVVDTGR